MNVGFSCDLCGGGMEAENVEPVQAEHLSDMFNREHDHTVQQVNDYIWANGRHPSGPALEYPTCDGHDDDTDDTDGGDVTV